MRRAILGTAGHIDHGKTALVRALTGIDCDRLPQEKARGITIDLGFAHFDLEEDLEGDLGCVRVGVVDVPGHERFVRNMLAGAAGIDIAMLVVAADDGIMPQTREHLAILELLGIGRGLIALTKCDLVEEDWVDLVELEARELVAGTFLAQVPIVRTSASGGRGIEELRSAIAGVLGEEREADGGGPFRLAVDRAFVKEGLGTVVTGTVWSGSLASGDEVEWLPRGRRVRVRGIQSHGESVERVGRGTRAAINLADVHHSEISRGDELATPGLLRASRLLSVELRVLEESPLPVRHRGRVRLHLGSGEVIAGVRLMEGTRLEPGEAGLAQLVCAAPVAAGFGQALVVRAESPMVTLGGGRVLQPNARPIRRRDGEAIERLGRLRGAGAADRVALAAWFRGERAFDAGDLGRDAGLDEEEVREIVAERVKRGGLVGVGGRVVHAERVKALERRLLSALESLHDEGGATIAVDALLHRLGYLDESLVRGMVGRLGTKGKLRDEGDRVALASRGPALRAGDARLREAILGRLDASGISPPDPDALAAELGEREGRIREVLTECVREGTAVHLGGTIFLHANRYREMVGKLGSALNGSGEMTVSAFREMMGTSRKYAVPILETLDKRGLTRRRGDVRVAGPNLAGEARSASDHE